MSPAQGTRISYSILGIIMTDFGSNHRLHSHHYNFVVEQIVQVLNFHMLSNYSEALIGNDVPSQCARTIKGKSCK